MKSAAFNLAFKVHRNEIPFPEGLLKAVDADAQEDFIEALNSLAGETKYDSDRLEQMIQDASKDVSKQSKKPKVDVESLRQELEVNEKKRKELKDNIQNIEARTSALTPNIVPGINSLLLFLVGFVATLIFFASGLVIVALIFLICTLVGAALLYIQDMSVYNKQLEEIKEKKERAKNEITKIGFQVDDLDNKIQEIKSQLNSVENEPAPQQETVKESQPKKDEPDIPPLI